MDRDITIADVSRTWGFFGASSLPYKLVDQGVLRPRPVRIGGDRFAYVFDATERRVAYVVLAAQRCFKLRLPALRVLAKQARIAIQTGRLDEFLARSLLVHVRPSEWEFLGAEAAASAAPEGRPV